MVNLRDNHIIIKHNIIMMVSLEIIKQTEWLPSCCSNRAHNFETGIECLRSDQPDLRKKLEKEQDMRKKLEKKCKPDDSQAEPNSNWAEQIETGQLSSSLPGPVLFGSAVLRDKASMLSRSEASMLSR